MSAYRMYKSYRDVSKKLTCRNRLMLHCQRFLGIIKHKIDRNENIFLTFVCVKSPRHSFSMFWKIFIAENDAILDVSREIGLILDMDAYNNSVLRTSSYGCCVQDEICRHLSRVFQSVFKKEIIFSYNYYDASLED